MDSKDKKRVAEIFDQARVLPSNERSAFVKRECGQNPEVCQIVLELLEARKDIGSFLQEPVLHIDCSPEPDDRALPANFLHYRVLERIGQGGMGEVYLAHDTKLDRRVAIKQISNRFEDSPHYRKRFLQEAQTAAALDHPNVCSVFETGQTEDGLDFIALEYIPGGTLEQRFADGPLSVKDSLRIAADVAEALQAAHSKGILHRDLKPSNIMFASQGHAKVTDFGLARQVLAPSQRQAFEDGKTGKSRTRRAGTPSYMSPEQAQGHQLDARSDQFSFGTVLYEMLTGRHPFRRDTPEDTEEALINEPAPKLAEQRIPRRLRRLVNKLHSKEPSQRYPTMEQAADELAAILSEASEAPGRRKRLLFSAAALVLLTYLVCLLALYSHLVHLSSQDRDFESWKTAVWIELVFPFGGLLSDLWPQFAKERAVLSEPSGATLFIGDTSDGRGSWEKVGQTPLESTFLPLGVFRVKLVKEGFHEIAGLGFNDEIADQPLRFQLHPLGKIPSGMVAIPKTKQETLYLSSKGTIQVPPFLIDKYEVTNEEYREFVENGGYLDPTYWKHPFEEGGKELQWEQAIMRFVDATGRPGPATWKGGRIPPGRAHHPVSGISWYEAAAYAEFRGRNLPTVFQWRAAASLGWSEVIVPFSKFGGTGTAPAGKYPGMSIFGVVDIAGNVREWCLNRISNGEGRYSLGGSWQDPPYTFITTNLALDSFDRSEVNGFRCVKNLEPIPELQTAPVARRDKTEIEAPVSDKDFDVIRGWYDYNRKPLGVIEDSLIEESDFWIKKKVSFNAAYGDERIPCYLLLPKNKNPPFAVLLYLPSLQAVFHDSSQDLRDMQWIEFIVQSGRAVVYPVYTGTYERRSSNPLAYFNSPLDLREGSIRFAKEIFRTIDFLETEPETFDLSRLGSYGYSMGAVFSPIPLALDTRLRYGVLLAGGLETRVPFMTEVDPVHFAPRVRVPALMVNGLYDSTHPYDISQKPLADLLGADHITYEADHSIYAKRRTARADILKWLQKHSPVG